MNYLVYIEHSAENLQFFLWYRDYVARFARLPASEKALSSLWVDEKFDDDMVKPSPRFVVDSRPSTSDKNLEALPGVLEIDADSTTSGDGDPFHDRPTSTRRTATSTSERTTTPYNWDEDKATWSTRRSDFREIAAGAYESLSIMQPCKWPATGQAGHQPLTDETQSPCSRTGRRSRGSSRRTSPTTARAS